MLVHQHALERGLPPESWPAVANGAANAVESKTLRVPVVLFVTVVEAIFVPPTSVVGKVTVVGLNVTADAPDAGLAAHSASAAVARAHAHARSAPIGCRPEPSSVRCAD